MTAAGSSARTRLIGDDDRAGDPGPLPPLPASVTWSSRLAWMMNADPVAVEERGRARGQGDPVGPCLEPAVPGLVDDQVRQVAGVRPVRVLEAVLMSRAGCSGRRRSRRSVPRTTRRHGYGSRAARSTGPRPGRSRGRRRVRPASGEPTRSPSPRHRRTSRARDVGPAGPAVDGGRQAGRPGRVRRSGRTLGDGRSGRHRSFLPVSMCGITSVDISSPRDIRQTTADVKPPRRARAAGTIRAMTETRLWDRAAACPSRPDGRRLPEVAALPETCRRSASCSTSCATPSCASRPCACASRSGRQTARGEDVVAMDVVLRHPGEAKVTTTPRRADAARPEYEVWISDGELVRTYASAHGLAPSGRSATGRAAWTTRTSRARRRSTSRSPRCRWRPCPTRSSTRPATARTCSPPAAARSPAPTSSRAARRSCSSATTRARPSSPATGPTSTSRSRSTARPGVILRLVEIDRRRGHPRTPRSIELAPDAPLPAVRLRLRLPHRDDDALLTPAVFPTPWTGAYQSAPSSRARAIGPGDGSWSRARPERRASDRPRRRAHGARGGQAAPDPASSRTSPRSRAAPARWAAAAASVRTWRESGPGDRRHDRRLALE